jgi:hypothetical protein
VGEAAPSSPIREAVGGLIEGTGATLAETGATVNEVVGGSSCRLLHTC